jgi:hypothetical protein
MGNKKRETISFATVEKEIVKNGWFRFGKKEFECTGLSKKSVAYYLNNNQLPHPCDKCYKGLIFWDGINEDSLTNFFKMFDSFGEVNCRGKLNDEVVVFYFRDKEKMLEFLDYLQNKMHEFNVKGKTQWRRACKMYQILKPKLWKNAKEFISATA